MTKQIVIAALIILTAATANIAFLVGGVRMSGISGGPTGGILPPAPPPVGGLPLSVNVQETGFGKFASEEEFRTYIEAGQALGGSYFGSGLGLTSARSMGMGTDVVAMEAPTSGAFAPAGVGGGGGGATKVVALCRACNWASRSFKRSWS